MINNIIIHDHRFDIRHWAQNPQLHVGPFHNLIRFLNAVNTSHCLISLHYYAQSTISSTETVDVFCNICYRFTAIPNNCIFLYSLHSRDGQIQLR